MIRHVIFDMDGTLADTARSCIPACARVSAQFGLPVLSDQAIRAAIGIANPEFYFRLYPQYERALILEYGREVERIEADFVSEIGRDILFPGIRALLERLVELGCTLYVASTGDAQHVDGVLQGAGIEHLFAKIRCGQSEKVRMVGEIIGSADKSEWAMVGDKDKDLLAARGNGILAVAAGYGYCDPNDYPLFDAVLQEPGELVEWVRGNDWGAAPNPAQGASPLENPIKG